jgi:hypothetical protein
MYSPNRAGVADCAIAGGNGIGPGAGADQGDASRRNQST